jgi:hypothetical protein
MSSSTFGYTVYAALGAAGVLWGAFTHAHRANYVTWDTVMTRLMRHPVSRWGVWALWAFIGWHLFVRGSGAFK